mgnify:FL=1|jgi:5-hydroxyisourate hydrolase
MIKMKKKKITSITLNSDGRSDRPLVEGDMFLTGYYELVFFVADYFKEFIQPSEIPFLQDVSIKFGVNNSKEHYHIPLLVTPWSYSTYRGS